MRRSRRSASPSRSRHPRGRCPAVRERTRHPSPRGIRVLAERLLSLGHRGSRHTSSAGRESLVGAAGAHLREPCRQAPRELGSRLEGAGRSPAGRGVEPSPPSGRSRSPRARSQGCRAGSARRDTAGSRCSPGPRRCARGTNELAELITSPDRGRRGGQLAGLSAENPVPSGELEDPGAAELRQLFVDNVMRAMVSSTRSSTGRCASPVGALAAPIFAVVTGSRPGERGTSTEQRGRVGSVRCGSATGAPSDLADEELHRVETHLLDRLVDCRQRRVASADSGMLSNPITDRSSGTVRPSRGRPSSSRSRTSRSRRRPPSDGRSSAAGGRAPPPRPGGSRRPGSAPGRGRSRPRERLAVALLAQARRLEVGAPGEEPDAAVAEADQVRVARRPRGCRSRRRAGRRRRAVVDGHDRRTGRDLDDGGGDQDRSVGERAADPRRYRRSQPPCPRRSAGREHDGS